MTYRIVSREVHYKHSMPIAHYQGHPGIVKLGLYKCAFGDSDEPSLDIEVRKYSDGSVVVIKRYGYGESWSAYQYIPRRRMLAAARKCRRPKFCRCMYDFARYEALRPNAVPYPDCSHCNGRGWHAMEAWNQVWDRMLCDTCLVRIRMHAHYGGPGMSFSHGGNWRKLGRHGYVFFNSGGLDI